MQQQILCSHISLDPPSSHRLGRGLGNSFSVAYDEVEGARECSCSYISSSESVISFDEQRERADGFVPLHGVHRRRGHGHLHAQPAPIWPETRSA